MSDSIRKRDDILKKSVQILLDAQAFKGCLERIIDTFDSRLTVNLQMKREIEIAKELVKRGDKWNT